MHVEIVSGDRQSQVTLQSLEVKTLGEPSMRLRVAYASQDFRGCSDRAWIWIAHLGPFITELRRLEVSGVGAAELYSLSPGDCMLKIVSGGAAQDVAVAVEIRRRQMTLDGGVEQRVSGGFVLDRSTLPGLIDRLVNLSKAKA